MRKVLAFSLFTMLLASCKNASCDDHKSLFVGADGTVEFENQSISVDDLSEAFDEAKEECGADIVVSLGGPGFESKEISDPIWEVVGKSESVRGMMMTTVVEKPE